MKTKHFFFTIILFYTVPQLIKSQTLITENDTINLSQNSVTLTVNKYRGQIQWQQSVDSILWHDITNAKLDSFLIPEIDSSGYYRAKITEGTCNLVYSDILRIIYGNEPKVKTLSVSNITSSSITCEGLVSDNGNQSIKEKGVVWGDDPDPTFAQNKIVSEGMDYNFQVQIEGLESNKTYYIKTYATNPSGTSYGEEMIFTTYSSNQGCNDQSDCCKLKYAHLAIASLDYNNEKYRALHDFLFELDRKYAYHVFTRNPQDFLKWCEMIDPTDITSWHALGGAIHETNHMTNSYLMFCDPFLNEKYLSFDNVYTTELSIGQTANYSIVEETIAENLKNHDRYKTYVGGAKNSNGNDFRVLIDELNSYTGGAWFDLQYFQFGLLPEILGSTTSDGGLSGMVNFMVFIGYYLKSARLNHLETYQEIKKQEVLIKLIQDLWSKAEKNLELCYPYTTLSGTESSYRMAVDLDYVKAVFSNELLNELDLLGIQHRPADYWLESYLK